MPCVAARIIRVLRVLVVVDGANPVGWTTDNAVGLEKTDETWTRMEVTEEEGGYELITFGSQNILQD